MKVKNISNPEEFLKVIDSCEGKVELITDDGDKFKIKIMPVSFIINNFFVSSKNT